MLITHLIISFKLSIHTVLTYQKNSAAPCIREQRSVDVPRGVRIKATVICNPCTCLGFYEIKGRLTVRIDATKEVAFQGFKCKDSLLSIL